jgi:hypothetical protein
MLTKIKVSPKEKTINVLCVFGILLSNILVS